MKKKLLAVSIILVFVVAFFYSRIPAYADAKPRQGWTPVYLTFPDGKPYVECIETGDPDDFCISTEDMFAGGELEP